jgi:hypothetical protein
MEDLPTQARIAELCLKAADSGSPDRVSRGCFAPALPANRINSGAIERHPKIVEEESTCSTRMKLTLVNLEASQLIAATFSIPKTS